MFDADLMYCDIARICPYCWNEKTEYLGLLGLAGNGNWEHLIICLDCAGLYVYELTFSGRHCRAVPMI